MSITVFSISSEINLQFYCRNPQDQELDSLVDPPTGLRSIQAFIIELNMNLNQRNPHINIVSCTLFYYISHMFMQLFQHFLFPGEIGNQRKWHSFNKLVPYTRIYVKFKHTPHNYVMHIAFGSCSSHIIIIVKSVVRIM